MTSWSWKHAGGSLAATVVAAAEPDIPWAALEAEPLPDTEREPTRAAWVRRAHDEYRSMVAFAELTQELTELAAPLDVLAGAARIVADEVRHVALCARVAEALGGSGPTPGEPRWVRSDKRRPLAERVALTMVASLAIGETLSVAGITDALEHTRHPTLRAVTAAILADERFHSRFGLSWLATCWRDLPYSTRLRVESALPEVFARLERDQPPGRHALFERVTREVILPELRAAGLRAGEAWAARSAS